MQLHYLVTKKCDLKKEKKNLYIKPITFKLSFSLCIIILVLLLFILLLH